MIATALIAFREGLEAFLMVGILLAYLRKLGAAHQGRWIFLGAGAGILASLVAALVLQVFVDQFDNDRYRTYLMVALLLTAAAVLSGMAIWMQRQARAHVDEMRHKLEGHIAAGNMVGLAMLAFVTVLREGLETVLFLSALVYSGQGVDLRAGAVGTVAGLAAAIAVVTVAVRGLRRVPVRQFFLATSLLVILIAAGLVSSAVNMMQAVALLPAEAHPLFDLSGLLDDRSLVGGFLRALFGYNSSPSPLQFGIWLVCLTAGLTYWLRGARRA